MASADNKNDYNMEAGLLSTDGEERIMSKEARFQDSEPAQPRQQATCRRISPARKALVAFAFCCLLGIGIASIGGATRLCPGHLRHGDVVGKHGMNAHKPNLSEAMAQLARRQNTPIPSDTNQPTEPTDGPTDAPTDGSTDAPTDEPTDAPTDGPTDEPTATDEPTNGPTEEPTDSATEEPTDSATEVPSDTAEPTATEPTESPSDTETNEPTATQPSEDTTTDDGSTASETQEPTETDASEPTATATQATTDASEAESTTEEPESTATGDEQETTTEESPSTTQRTITGTGTRRTSSAVPRTYTSTLEDGGVTTLTSTSWVAVVPSAEATTSSNPDLQNAAPRYSVGGVLSAVVGMVFGGLMLL